LRFILAIGDRFALSHSTPRLYATKVAAAPRAREAYEKEQCRRFARSKLWLDEYEKREGLTKTGLSDCDDD